jgi:hypothetical protein
MAKAASEEDLLRHAREGNVASLLEVAAADPHAAYFWLLVAHDLGHDEAADGIGDIEECYDFKYDDDGLARMTLHRALAEAYLKGTRGLDVNVERGKKHLEEYLDVAQAVVEGGGVDDLRALAADLQGDARLAVEVCIEGQPFRAVRRRIDRAQRFYELMREGTQIPTVIVEAELDALLVDAKAVVTLLRARM